MDILDKSKEELLIELQGLKKENADLKASHKIDLTESKQTHDEILKFHRAVESSGEAIFMTDMDGLINYINPEFTYLYGYSAEEVIGKTTPRILKSGTMNAEAYDYFWQTILSNKIVQGELINKTKDGRFLNIEGSANPILDENGNRIGFLAIQRDITERKRIEIALSENEKQYHTLVDNLSSGVVVYNNDKSIILSNPLANSLLGLTDEHINGKKVITSNISFLNQDSSLMSDEYFPVNRVLNSNSSFSDLIFGILHHGKENPIWIICNAYPVRDSDEKILQVILTFRDITELKSTEEALKESREKYSTIYRNTPVMLHSIDNKGILVSVSDYWLATMGYSREEVLGRKSTDFLTDASKKYATDIVLPEFQKTGFCNNIEYQFVKKNGEIIDVLLSASSERNKQRKIILSLAVITDITHRKRAEIFQRIQHNIASAVVVAKNLDELFETVREELNKLIDTTNFYIAFYNPDSGMLSSPFEKDEMGVVPEWPAENSLTGLVIKKKKSLLLKQEDITELTKSGKIEQYGARSEIWLGTPLKIGNRILGAIVVQSYKDPNAYNQSSIEILEIIASNLSIYIEHKQAEYDLRQSEQQLKKINSEKDRFFSIIAHDLKSPFSGLLGLTKIMAEEIQNLSMKEMQEFASSLQTSADNLYKLLVNLLEWSRMQRGVTEFNLEEITLSFIVKQNLDILGEFAKQKNIEFINNVEENLVVTADIPMLNTVLRNLISNSIKFTPRGGKVEIGAYLKSSTILKQSENYTEIYIKDNGIGMNIETIEKLFRIDQKVSRPGTEGESSTGLGLLLCKEFVERHDGNIWVDSEVGKGSTFYFTLPNNLNPLSL